jgi:hypothetical protein
MRRLVPLLAAVVVVAGCRFELMQVPLPDYEWFSPLEGEGEWAHLAGRVTFTWDEGANQIPAAAELWGDEPRAVRTWRINTGTCGNPGTVVGTDAHYPRLTIDSEGNAFAVTSVPVAVDPTRAFHVTVHYSEAEMGNVIVCSDFVRVAAS